MSIAWLALEFLLAPKERNVPCATLHRGHGAPPERFPLPSGEGKKGKGLASRTNPPPLRSPKGRGRKQDSSLSDNSLQRLCSFEKLFRQRVFQKILCHHSPANCRGRIDQELSRTRNVSAACYLFGVNQIIAANCLEFWIREKTKSVSSFLNHVFASFLGRINADPHDTDSGLVKLIYILFDTPQLGVTHPSPIASVKN